jgi:3-dehydroquinate dehydratase II
MDKQVDAAAGMKATRHTAKSAPLPIVMVLNGPNLNLLGTREPTVYGSQSLADVQASCEVTAAACGLALDFRQSNHEGVLIDAIHEAGRWHAAGTLAGLVINAGAYTHTSIALADAIKGTGIRAVELHISNVHARESFRHHSYLSPVCKAVMCGFGVAGYALAIAAVAQWDVIAVPGKP